MFSFFSAFIQHTFISKIEIKYFLKVNNMIAVHNSIKTKSKYSAFAMVLIILTFFCVACDRNNNDNKLEHPFVCYSMENDNIQTELDKIYSLLAYSLVLKDWQTDSIPRYARRGYNIGTILVNRNKEVYTGG